jgi:hypothetical protein
MTPAPATPAAAAYAAATTGAVASPQALGLADLLRTLREPRKAVRDPRILAGGVIAIGLVVLLFSLLGGGGPSNGLLAGASPSAGTTVVAAPGEASLTLTRALPGTYALTGATGFGKPVDDQLDSSWTDATGSSLALTGRVASVTRTTGKDLVLTLTMIVAGRPVTFTSDGGECTVGMAVKVFSVTGSFVCPELVSDDGKITVKANGTYET